MLNDDIPMKYMPREFQDLLSILGCYLHDVHSTFRTYSFNLSMLIYKPAPGIPSPGIDVKLQLPVVCYTDAGIPTHQAAENVIEEISAPSSPFLNVEVTPDSVSICSSPISDESDQAGDWSTECENHTASAPQSGDWSAEYEAHADSPQAPLDHTRPNQYAKKCKSVRLAREDLLIDEAAVCVEKEVVRVIHLERAWYSVIVGRNPGVYNGM